MDKLNITKDTQLQTSTYYRKKEKKLVVLCLSHLDLSTKNMMQQDILIANKNKLVLLRERFFLVFFYL